MEDTAVLRPFATRVAQNKGFWYPRHGRLRKAWACPALRFCRRCAVCIAFNRKGDPLLPLSDAFERAVEDLSHSSAFANVEVVAHSLKRQSKTQVLQVMIDREGGVDIELCGRVASALNSRLEEFDEQYTLEVESAGLNRPLVKAGDYTRFSGKDAKIMTTLLINGSKTHRGVLRGVQGTNVILDTERGALPLPLATIKSANLEYDIRNDLKREKLDRKKT